MSGLLTLHLVAIGLWLGCILTEALFERALLAAPNDSRLTLATLHKRVDLFVEIPAFVAVLVSGALLLRGAPITAMLGLKVACAMLAIVANLYCVRLVFVRLAHAQAGRWHEFAQVDAVQHKMGAVVLVALLAALGLGATR
jgi:hypothetical protein